METGREGTGLNVCCNLTQINDKTIYLDLITMAKRDVKNLEVPIPPHILTKKVLTAETEDMIDIMSLETEIGDRVIVAAVTPLMLESMENIGTMVMIL